MYHNELYNFIYKGEIKESLYLVTELILQNKDKNIELIENTLISICSYIGTFISIYDIRLWVDVVEETLTFINYDKIVIKNIYLLITKLCIVCDIYIKKPISKSGILTVQKLREKIIDLFPTSDNVELNYYTINKFQSILPPSDSETYKLAQLIIYGVLSILNSIEDLDIENDDEKIHFFSNKLRDLFDYFSRKNTKFENKFSSNDNDSIWFLWGILNISCNNDDITNIAYQLFLYNYTKKLKNERSGLLWGASIALIFTYKKNIARVWNKDEIILIKKINEISMDLYKEIKKIILNTNTNTNIRNEINENNENENIKSSHGLDGLHYLINYLPQLKNNPTIEYNYNNQNITSTDVKKINTKYK